MHAAPRVDKPGVSGVSGAKAGPPSSSKVAQSASVPSIGPLRPLEQMLVHASMTASTSPVVDHCVVPHATNESEAPSAGEAVSASPQAAASVSRADNGNAHSRCVHLAVFASLLASNRPPLPYPS